jgi:hypothetical protein
MSFDALAWAARQNTGSSGTKLVLLGLAECADRAHNLAFPSVAALVEFSSLDRKSVMSNLDKLEAAGIITDTGRRVGATKQIKVYQLNLEAVPILGQSQKRNSSGFPANGPKNGTRNKSEPKEAKASYKVIIDRWNERSKGSGIPPVRVLNHSRQQMINARIKEHGLNEMLRAVENVHNSPFCRGEQGDGRKADIMLILQPKTLPRVLEGFYGVDETKVELGPAERLAQLKRMIPKWIEWGDQRAAEQARRMIAEIEAANPMAAQTAELLGQIGQAA